MGLVSLIGSRPNRGGIIQFDRQVLATLDQAPERLRYLRAIEILSLPALHAGIPGILVIPLLQTTGVKRRRALCHPRLTAYERFPSPAQDCRG